MCDDILRTRTFLSSCVSERAMCTMICAVSFILNYFPDFPELVAIQ